MENALKKCNIDPNMGLSSQMAMRIQQNMATAVLLFDKDLQLLSINSAGEGLLSVSVKRILGMTPNEIWPDSAFFSETIKQSLKTGRTCIERGMDMYLNKNQKIKVDCMITPILDEEDDEVLVELVDANAFMRVVQEESQQTVQEAAKESVQGIAHEIKNPLGGIRGAAQLLEQELENKELSEYTRIIINESDRLRNFIDRMLTTSDHPVKTTMNIHEVLEYVVSVVTAENEHKLTIHKDYDPSIPEIRADREQIIQTVLNLLRNAIQAIDKTHGEIRLHTRIQRLVTIQHKLNRHIIVLDIIDNGPGIPAEIEAGAFYPMITSRPEGTGLGLSIAQQLIQSHGGLINYERKNDYTYFSILLPMEQANG